jgi:hypothetical protein
MQRAQGNNKSYLSYLAFFFGLILQWGTFVSLTHHHRVEENTACSSTHAHAHHMDNEETEDCSLCLVIVQYGAQLSLLPTSIPTPWISLVHPLNRVHTQVELTYDLLGRLQPRAPPIA